MKEFGVSMLLLVILDFQRNMQHETDYFHFHPPHYGIYCNCTLRATLVSFLAPKSSTCKESSKLESVAWLHRSSTVSLKQ